jgi:IS30 family transposase
MINDSGLNDENRKVVHRMHDKGYNSTSIACYVGVDPSRIQTEITNYEDSKSKSYIKTAKKALGFA